ncbi:MAG: hypothetical protein M1824_004109 [Vezdaea acicularis]|nr:MAG: hypothetical protein M1824_004109 [Vezdaea acicularis]
MSNVSADLIWEIARGNNAYLVKRRTGGGVQFSRDPLNLANKQSRKYSGFVNNKAVGLHSSDKDSITLTTKKSKHHNKPASNLHNVSWGANKPSRKVYSGIVAHTAKNGYRPDLRAESVARASAIRRSHRPTKETPEKKARGAKAKKAAETKSS